MIIISLESLHRGAQNYIFGLRKYWLFRNGVFYLRTAGVWRDSMRDGKRTCKSSFEGLWHTLENKWQSFIGRRLDIGASKLTRFCSLRPLLLLVSPILPEDTKGPQKTICKFFYRLSSSRATHPSFWGRTHYFWKPNISVSQVYSSVRLREAILMVLLS